MSPEQNDTSLTVFTKEDHLQIDDFVGMMKATMAGLKEKKVNVEEAKALTGLANSVVSFYRLKLDVMNASDKARDKIKKNKKESDE